MSTIPFTPENLEILRKAAAELLGSCKSADEVLQAWYEDESITLSDLAVELLHELDDITMECTVCGWWSETGFINDEGVCADCEEDGEEDE